MTTFKLFVGGTPDEVRAAYAAWWGQQKGIQLTATPQIEPAGSGWKLAVWYTLKPKC